MWRARRIERRHSGALGSLALTVQSEYSTSWIFFFRRGGTLLKPPVTCASICASARGSGWWGLRFSNVVPSAPTSCPCGPLPPSHLPPSAALGEFLWLSRSASLEGRPEGKSPNLPRPPLPGTDLQATCPQHPSPWGGEEGKQMDEVMALSAWK